MKIDVQPQEDHQVKLVVAVEPEKVAEYRQRAAREIAKKTKIPGFRPGKAPYPVVLRMFGEDALTEEAMELLANDAYGQAMDEADLRSYGPGALIKVTKEPPSFEYLVPLRAEVTLGDYAALRLPYEPPQVSEEEVDGVIARLREQAAVIEPADRPAQEGDVLSVALSSVRLEPQEDENPTLLAERSVTVNVLEAEAQNANEWPFPGFSRQLIGQSAGDELHIPYTYPQDARVESLRGVQAEFTARIEDVKTKTLPEADDEFAQTTGQYADLAELRSVIRKDLEEYAVNDYHEKFDDQVLEELVKLSTIKYPPLMVEDEIDSIIQRLENRLEQQRIAMDVYLKSRQMDMPALRQETRPAAEERLRKSLALMEAAQALEVKITPEELQAEINHTLGHYARMMDEREYTRFIAAKETAENLASNTMMGMILDRGRERLRDIARGLAEIPAEAPVETEATVEAAAETPAPPADPSA
ncbi:MAG: trigger factor [Chloroflexi bacterium]|nr:trigger factor [Chloroflexota bacterium]